MKRVLVTGMSGAGKSTLLAELAARGYRTVDTDYGDYFETVDGEELWRDAEIAETLTYLAEVEPLLRASATLEVVTTVGVGAVADAVLAHVRQR
ncbi:AAA family ATPase [Mycolicibacterium sp. 050158]|nr:AAA family ATPase [Mycolicibacterium sp. 050158]MDX1890654.1 AAA family ATPase [Mycolicibacterium sp. 050158]